MKVVSGIFDNDIAAEQAISELLSKGFEKEDVSLMVTDKGRQDLFGSLEEDIILVAKTGIAISPVGSILASMVTELITIESVHVPNASIMAIGPIALALSGMGHGNGMGGLTSALVSAGFMAEDVRTYENALLKGNAILLVHVENADDIILAENALRHSGAILQAA